MTDTRRSSPADSADRAREWVADFGLHDGALGAVLFGLVEQLDAPLSVKDIASGQYVHANVAMAALVGLTPPQVLGKTDAALFGADAAASLRTADLAARDAPHPQASEHRVESAGQPRRDFSVMRVLLPAADAQVPKYLCAVWLETTALHQRESQLAKALAQLEQQHAANEALRRETQDQSLRDGVTGLYQRAHFEDQLRREVDLSSREHREFALVSIALDPLADDIRPLGDAARARVLEALGRLLRSNTRAMDASCRLDGDHFAVLLSGVGLATAHSRMEGLRRQCATQIVVLDGRDFGFSVSMGVASFPHTAHTQEALMDAADGALAEARRRGGNYVTLASIRFENG